MVLFHHIIYGLQRIHTGMYMMVETAGALSPEQLDAIQSPHGAARYRVPRRRR